jgi:hypothetical protein
MLRRSRTQARSVARDELTRWPRCERSSGNQACALNDNTYLKRHRETLQFIGWRAATIWRTMRRLDLRHDAVESRAGGRRERLAGGA